MPGGFLTCPSPGCFASVCHVRVSPRSAAGCAYSAAGGLPAGGRLPSPLSGATCGENDRQELVAARVLSAGCSYPSSFPGSLVGCSGTLPRLLLLPSLQPRASCGFCPFSAPYLPCFLFRFLPIRLLGGGCSVVRSCGCFHAPVLRPAALLRGSARLLPSASVCRWISAFSQFRCGNEKRGPG